MASEERVASGPCKQDRASDMSDAFQGDLLAEETHSGRGWGVLILLAVLGPWRWLSLSELRRCLP